MREIKFRGKNYGGIWLYGYLMPAEKPVINKGCKYRISVSPQACAGKDKIVYEVITDTIGQFTGFKDDDGKDVYEGDIVVERDFSFKSKPYVVKYDAEYGAFRFFGSGKGCLLSLDFIDMKVIGNIHDNPELLKS